MRVVKVEKKVVRNQKSQLLNHQKSHQQKLVKKAKRATRMEKVLLNLLANNQKKHQRSHQSHQSLRKLNSKRLLRKHDRL